MLDLIVRSANLPDGRCGYDIGVRDGRIVEIAPRLDASAPREIDARGRLVTPPFVDSHFHMDATLSFGRPRFNESGTLLEGIAIWAEQKPRADRRGRARTRAALCTWAIAHGNLAIRTHVDVCDDTLVAVDALLDVRRTMAPYIDLQLVAFPQDGFLRSPKRAPTSSARWIGASTLWAGSRTSNGRWPTARPRCATMRNSRSARVTRRHALRRNR